MALKLVDQRDEGAVSAIEAGFPHVARQICARWGKPACVAYLDNLLAYSGGGTSKGFPPEVIEELFSLFTLAQTESSTWLG
jgi:hypothetical protein